MSEFDVKIDPANQAVYSRLENMPGNTRQSIRRGYFEYGKLWKKEVERATREPKTGKVYTRTSARGRRRTHRASAPGESHASDTGKLTKSAGWKVNGQLSMDLGYGADGKKVPIYAAAIELGRLDGTIAARPTIANAVDKTQADLARIIANSINRSI